MERSIRTFLENGHENGLYLIPGPTGIGKTKAVVNSTDWAIENTDLHIIYTTNLNKNLDDFERSLRELLGDRYDELVLRLPAYVDQMINVLPGLRNTIFRSGALDDASIVDKLCKLVDVYKTLKEAKQKDAEAISKAKEDIRNAERKLRFLVREALAKMFPNVESRIDASIHDKDWNWVSKLYPSILIPKRRVLVMSTAKLLAVNDPIASKQYTFLNSDDLAGSVLFIDEFDATKEAVLDWIIGDRHHGVDCFRFFRQVRDRFADLDKLPTKLFGNGPERLDGSANPIWRRAEEVRKETIRINETYGLDFLVKCKNSSNGRALFHDTRSRIIGSKGISMTRNTDDQQIVISFEDKRDESGRMFMNMLYDLYRLTSTFEATALEAAEHMVDRNIKNGDQPFPLDLAVSLVLKALIDDADTREILKSEILVRRARIRGPARDVCSDTSFYANGFRYLQFVSDDSEEFVSDFVMTAHQLTPEAIMLALANRFKVIGISATAVMPTVLGNYSIRYLETRLGDRFQLPDDDTYERIRARLSEKNSCYVDVDLATEVIDAEDNPEHWKTVFGKNASAAKRIVENSSESEFDAARYLKLTDAFQRWWNDDRLESILFFLNKFPKSGDKRFDIDTVSEIVALAAEKVRPGTGEDAKGSLVVLGSEGFGNRKEEILKRLSDGDKVAVLTTYGTLGAGQNMQYDIPKYSERADDEIRSEKKDFSAVFLERPTNLIPPIVAEDFHNSLARYVFYVEFLRDNREITMSEASECIREAFAAPVKKPVAYVTKNDIGACPSVRASGVSIINQALGRIDRTTNKGEAIRVYADRSIQDLFDMPIEAYGRLQNPEFVSLYDAMKELGTPDRRTVSYQAIAKDVCTVSIGWIISRISGPNGEHEGRRHVWTDDNIAEWESLRDFVLTHPTTDSDRSLFPSQHYVELPEPGDRLWFRQEGDFDSTEVSFKPSAGYSEVSSESARLDEILSIPGVREEFERRGYATSFKPDRYLMCPPIFQNIYKGALGEVAGTVVLRDVLGIEVSRMPKEIYEVFDGVVCVGIYVDWKHWHDRDVMSEDAFLEKNFRKLKEIGGRKVVVANILRDRDSDVKPYTTWERDGMKVIEVAYIYDPSKAEFNHDALNMITKEVMM